MPNDGGSERVRKNRDRVDVGSGPVLTVGCTTARRNKTTLNYPKLVRLISAILQIKNTLSGQRNSRQNHILLWEKYFALKPVEILKIIETDLDEILSLYFLSSLKQTTVAVTCNVLRKNEILELEPIHARVWLERLLIFINKPLCMALLTGVNALEFLTRDTGMACGENSGAPTASDSLKGYDEKKFALNLELSLYLKSVAGDNGGGVCSGGWFDESPIVTGHKGDMFYEQFVSASSMAYQTGSYAYERIKKSMIRRNVDVENSGSRRGRNAIKFVSAQEYASDDYRNSKTDGLTGRRRRGRYDGGDDEDDDEDDHADDDDAVVNHRLGRRQYLASSPGRSSCRTGDDSTTATVDYNPENLHRRDDFRWVEKIITNLENRDKWTILQTFYIILERCLASIFTKTNIKETLPTVHVNFGSKQPRSENQPYVAIASPHIELLP